MTVKICQRVILTFYVTIMCQRYISKSGSAAMAIKVGDRLPSGILYENNPSVKVDILKEFGTGKHIIFAVPGAFTPGSSATHLSGFVENAESFKRKGIQQIACISVNDPFVMEAWGKAHQADGKIRMLADTCGNFTKAVDLEKDLAAVLGNKRSQRYSMVVEDGVVKVLNIEPDGTGLTCSLAPEILKQI